MKKFFQQILKDENGIYSSKRFAGILCVLILNLSLVINVASKREFTPSPELITAIETIALGSLGLTILDKYTLRAVHKSDKKKTKENQQYLTEYEDNSQFYAQNQNEDKE